jgi:GTP-binding protein
LPGYGYARVPERIRGRWAEMIEEYLRESRGLQLVVQIVDARHEPTVLDHQMVEWLRAADRESLIVATKADKLSRNVRERTQRSLKEQLGVNEVLLFSAKTGEGRKELWQVLRRTCELGS